MEDDEDDEDNELGKRSLSLNQYLFFFHLRSLLGVDMLKSALGDIKNDLCPMSLSLLPSIGLFSTRCEQCKAGRLLHTFCYHCGHVFDVTRILVPPSQPSMGKQWQR